MVLWISSNYKGLEQLGALHLSFSLPIQKYAVLEDVIGEAGDLNTYGLPKRERKNMEEA